jgi:uncharacterized protein YbjT (DUF2867 family)
VILVTGASGLVGGEVARVLATARSPLRLALRDPGARPVELPPADAVRFDFQSPESFPAALSGVESVFLVRPPQLARARRHFGPFVRAMEQAAVRRVVFLSVRGADRNPLLPHHGIERLLEGSRLAWTHLRPNDFMQNFLTVHRDDIRDRDEIWAPAGDGRTSYVDVRDVAEAAARILLQQGHERRAYTLTGPQSLSLHEVAAILGDALGRTVVYRDPGLASFLRHARAAGRPLPMALVMSTVYSIARLGLAEKVEDALPRLLGRRATTFAGFAVDHARTWTPDDGAVARGRAGSR